MPQLKVVRPKWISLWLWSYLGGSVSTAAAIMALLGAVAVVVGKFMGWEWPLAPEFAWLACTVLLVIAQAVKYRTLYGKYKSLGDAAHNDAMLNPAQRARVHHIKEIASRINGGMRGLSGIDRPSLDAWMDELCQEGGALGDHRGPSQAALFYVGCIQTFMRSARESPADAHLELSRSFQREELKFFESLMDSCNRLLEAYPPKGAVDD